MTIAQIQKEIGGFGPIKLSNGNFAFKVDDTHVHIIELEELIHPGDYSYNDKGILELPIILFSEDTIYIGDEHNSNDIKSEERKEWISIKDLPNRLNGHCKISK